MKKHICKYCGSKICSRNKDKDFHSIIEKHELLCKEKRKIKK